MQTNSNRYIIWFAFWTCVVCSLLVASAAVFLKARQERNVVLDKQRNVLAVSGLLPAGKKLSAAEVQKLFNERVQPVLVDMQKGEVAGADVNLDPQTYDEKKAAEDPTTSYAAGPNMSAISRVANYMVVYEVFSDADRKKVDQYVLPVHGLGLWGTLWGFLSMDGDGNTIRGLTFYSHKETPGLGGEVDNPRWKALWPGRKAYDEKGDPVIRVIKGNAGPAAEDPHKVDGLSGATITSNGVTHLLQFWLGDKGFGPYLAHLRGEGSN